MDSPTEIGYLEDIEIHHHAEDVKAVRFIGSSGVAEVSVTDQSMDAFLETAEEVHKSIEEDMAEIEAIFLGEE